MSEYILLMHNDSTNVNPDDWNGYIAKLNRSENFEGGSAMGGGVCLSKKGEVKPVSRHLSGYMRIKANNIDHAQELVKGNPVFEAGGTIEIRELTQS